ncbi:MAG TPA: guanylate kinase [Clostridiaceae bacterium]|nr:guanylate kinase [Clostridiaceae bacterium]
MPCNGLLVVLSAPSGTGKGTLVKLLREQDENIRLSVSATTREPRKGEIDGCDYFFKTVEEFERMIKNNELIEWVKYCDNYYGTPREFIDSSLCLGYDVLLEIDVEGAANIKKLFPESVLVFILPPSFDELKKRIVGRGTEKPEVIQMRLEQAKKELGYISIYDYVVVNDKIEDAVQKIRSIITAEKLKYNRNKDILAQIGMQTGGTF